MILGRGLIYGLVAAAVSSVAAAQSAAQPATVNESSPAAVGPDAGATVDETRHPLGSASAALIERGNKLFEMGDIASARLFYESAAAGGDARAATSVGKTYDPVHLERLAAVSATADPVEAIRWYRRGTAQGDPEAPLRLQLLVKWLGIEETPIGENAALESEVRDRYQTLRDNRIKREQAARDAAALEKKRRAQAKRNAGLEAQSQAAGAVVQQSVPNAEKNAEVQPAQELQSTGTNENPGPGALGRHYDDVTEFGISDRRNGFMVTVYHAPLQIIPDYDAARPTCRKVVRQVAQSVADSKNREIRPVRSEHIQTRIWRGTIDIRTRCLATAVIRYR